MTGPDDVCPHEDDAFHERVKEHFLLATVTSQLPQPPWANRYRITWLCGQCEKLHNVTGCLLQTVETLGFFLQQGYPVVQVVNMALEEIAAMEGVDIRTGDGLKCATVAYKEFLDKT